MKTDKETKRVCLECDYETYNQDFNHCPKCGEALCPEFVNARLAYAGLKLANSLVVLKLAFERIGKE